MSRMNPILQIITRQQKRQKNQEINQAVEDETKLGCMMNAFSERYDGCPLRTINAVLGSVPRTRYTEYNTGQSKTGTFCHERSPMLMLPTIKDKHLKVTKTRLMPVHFPIKSGMAYPVICPL
ncbi:hypothetical protein DN757_07080 [Paenibacillus silvae]|uniref:Uncharacterized protein n=1 Tax=Paenibacillus silvae TaxID=1325358 RepID=A0A2W6NKH4_9BACL|nr:hypothetical protein DN757_07080 [Paenibacillus silvae]